MFAGAASLTAVALTAPSLLADPKPAGAVEDVTETVVPSASYVQFDVQLSPEETGKFVVEVHPGGACGGVVVCVCVFHSVHSGRLLHISV